MQTLKKILFLLTLQERKQAGLLLLLIIVMAFIDMIGVASILPFMAVLTNPILIDTNSVLNAMFQTSKIFGVENNQEFLFALGFLVFVLLILSLAFKTFTSYAQVRFVEMREYSISKRLVEGYLHQPYIWFLSHNSADIGKTILSEVQGLINNGIRPLIEIFAKSILAIALIVLLIIVNPKLGLIVIVLLFGSYLLIFYFIKKHLNRIGEKRLINNHLRFSAVSEAFGASKEMKVSGLEKYYIKLFSNSAQIFAQTQTSLLIISQLPRFILEGIAFGGVLLIILYNMSQTGHFKDTIPIISLYIFAGYRLMPALQTIYSSFSQIAFASPSLEKLENDIKNFLPFNKNEDQEILLFNKSISLKNIYYNYPETLQLALQNIYINIPARSTIGLIGTTGSGKTTLVDIILGLLEPQKGSLEVDGKLITKKNLRSWQKSIGYVPQHIYLSDASIASNIAFGVESKDFSYEAIENAAKIANLHDFVINELPNQYQTTIGERGVKLSGGQRQRIGIARALYHRPQLLIFDEATSALDNQTEHAVMEAVNNIGKNITIILIAHRLNTLKKCDLIYKFEKGQIISQGSFEELIKSY